MKALSLKPEWALPVLLGDKDIECRTWETDYRGPLLICASSNPIAGTIGGHALCIVELVDIEPFKEKHMEGACMDPEIDSVPKNAYAWHFDNLEWVEPFPVKGKLHIYDVDDELIHVIPESVGCIEALEKYYEPLIRWSDRQHSEPETRAYWNEIILKGF